MFQPPPQIIKPSRTSQAAYHEELLAKSLPDVLELIPEHVRGIQDRITASLSSEKRKQIAVLLILYEDVFAKHDFDLGHFDLLEHEIHLYEDAIPVKERMRRTPLCYQAEEEKTLNKMLAAGVIEPSTSEWAFILCVKYRLA